MSELQLEKKVYFSKSITKEQSKDTGLALALIFLLIGYFTGNTLFFKLAIPVILIVMITPRWFYPLAILWFAFSAVLGTIMSQIILTLVYFIIVFPIAMIRKMAKKDNLKLNQFRKGKESVMVIRDHVFNRSDIEKPY